MNHVAEIAAEIGDHCGNAAELNHGSHGNTWISPARQHRHHLEMRRAADGQEFVNPCTIPRMKLRQQASNRPGAATTSVIAKTKADRSYALGGVGASPHPLA